MHITNRHPTKSLIYNNKHNFPNVHFIKQCNIVENKLQTLIVFYFDQPRIRPKNYLNFHFLQLCKQKSTSQMPWDLHQAKNYDRSLLSANLSTSSKIFGAPFCIRLSCVSILFFLLLGGVLCASKNIQRNQQISRLIGVAIIHHLWILKVNLLNHYGLPGLLNRGRSLNQGLQTFAFFLHPFYTICAQSLHTV